MSTRALDRFVFCVRPCVVCTSYQAWGLLRHMSNDEALVHARGRRLHSHFWTQFWTQFSLGFLLGFSPSYELIRCSFSISSIPEARVFLRASSRLLEKAKTSFVLGRQKYLLEYVPIIYMTTLSARRSRVVSDEFAVRQMSFELKKDERISLGQSDHDRLLYKG
jgi:hypothetical protein